MKTMRTHYAILGVRCDASDDDIKQAYRRSAFDNHPDRNPGDREAEARFHACRDAYEVLSNPTQRAAHDRELRAAQRPRPSARRPTPARPNTINVRARRSGSLLDLLRDIDKVVTLFTTVADAYHGHRWDPRSRRWRDREGRFIAR